MNWNPVILEWAVWGLNLELRLFGLLTMLVAGSMYPKYIRSMTVGDTVVVDGKEILIKLSPPRSTWFLWVALDLVAFGGQLGEGRFDPLMFTYIIGTAVIALLTIPYGKKGWSKLDSVCTVVVAVAIILWLFIGPSVATACALVGITVSMFPLLEGVMLRGEYEDRVAWQRGVLSSLLNLLDGQVLVSTWIALLQALVLFSISYHWGRIKQLRTRFAK